MCRLRTDLLVGRIMTVASSASTPCCVVTTPVAILHVAVHLKGSVPPCVYGAYVGPMLIHVRLLEAMLGPYSNHVELMLSQERRVPFKALPGPKGTHRFLIMSGACWAYVEPVYGAYVGPMLIHVRLLEAMLGPYSGHVELVLSQKQRVPFKPLPGPKGTRRFLIMSGPLLGIYGAYVGPMLIHVRLLEAMLGPYSSHVELMLSQERRVPFKALPGPKGTRRFWSMSGSCWAYTGPMLGLYGAYVGPMLIHVRLLEAMLGPYSSHVELMLSQERHVPFKPLPGPKGARHFWIMSGPCWAYVEPVYGAYVGPMLIHVRLLEAMSGPYSSHVELMLSQERHVPFKPLPGPKGARHFWIMSGPCWAYVEPVYGAYVGPMLIHVRLLEAMSGPYSSHVELMLSQERHVPFKPLPGPKGTRCFWIMSGPLLGVYGAYVGPMLIHVRLLEAMLGPYSSHVELMLQ